MAREWCVEAGRNPAAFDALSQDTFGILSLGRRRDLLAGIQAGDWNRVWESVTFSDLYFLADRYLARYTKNPWDSPVDATLRRSAAQDRGRLRILGPLLTSLEGYTHSDLVPLAPYEGFERRLFHTEMAERTAEMKLYLSECLDRMALPASLLPAMAEPVARMVFGSVKMADQRDWAAAIRAFGEIDRSMIAEALRQ